MICLMERSFLYDSSLQSSRGDFVGSGPVAGIYQPRPVPRQQKDIGAYLNDELLQLGGRINSIFEGGAFPPQSEMPRRWRDGMMVFFTQPLPDVYNKGDSKGQVIIASSGVWLYRKDFWWKIIDDPSSVIGGITVYQLGDSFIPATPSDGTEVPPTAPDFGVWEVTPPDKGGDKALYIWASVLAGYNDESGIYSWATPAIWSGGVTDGEQGIPGELFETWYSEFPSGNPGPPENYPPIDPGAAAIWERTTPVGATETIWSTFAKITPDLNVPDDSILTSAWSYPNQVTGTDGGDGTDGVDGVSGLDGSWVSWVYKASPTIPATPIGGSFDGTTEIPPSGWFDDPYFEEGSITWVSSNRYENTSPGVWQQVGVWSVAAEYSQKGDDGSTIFRVYQHSADNINWHDDFLPGDKYQRYATSTDGVLSAWSDGYQYTGDDGIDGIRGTINVDVAIPGSVWDDQAAYNAIVNSGVIGPAVPILWDSVVEYNDVAGFAETRRYNGGNPGTWLDVGAVIDGDLIVTGTIHGDKIITGTIEAEQIAAGTITGDKINASDRITIGGGDPGLQDVVILDGTDPTARIWVGNVSSGTANFKVAPNGDTYIGGNSTIDGDVNVLGQIYAENMVGTTTGVYVDSFYFNPPQSDNETGVAAQDTFIIPPATFDRYLSTLFMENSWYNKPGGGAIVSEYPAWTDTAVACVVGGLSFQWLHAACSFPLQHSGSPLFTPSITQGSYPYSTNLSASCSSAMMGPFNLGSASPIFIPANASEANRTVSATRDFSMGRINNNSSYGDRLTVQELNLAFVLTKID